MDNLKLESRVVDNSVFGDLISGHFEKPETRIMDNAETLNGVPLSVCTLL
jgi:hypothetical protein